ncbi:TMhelix containing protein [Vibrio phage 1.152.O._10N.222.46.E1]|uniref:TMhelix containing protein n=4 Tax=Nahantvirus 49C7 TaxID=2846601 RepID=A0A2I7RBG6_9CAUD|nr:TMhelix containing protein [Vibrio phage 1.025.O._10N.222.46.B6]AUR90810.1 TMhelix containing protein [Vibrio phage 1.150.O._10N.222.46.A6]AUR90983.1 TMhelix containing protein [Vibrio phage 1.152.O._10N.222.46.E1]AUS02451.1 TMhelix containing protein [Vibrio phage 2.130.O._10N.222.46.C2]
MQILGLLAFIGWILNIVQIASAGVITGWVLLKATGVLVFPLGAILGFINLLG